MTTLNTTDSIDTIVAFGRERGACTEALTWLGTQPDAATAWQSCERPDCARTALRFVPEGEKRPLHAIETTERWLTGDATIEEVRTDADAAAAYDAPAAYAAYAAYAAAYAAYAAAYDAAYAAYAAA